MQTLNLFAEHRLTLERSIELTAENMRERGSQYNHWSISFSGGKDSTATVAVIVKLLDEGRIPRPKSLTVLYADTGMELPPLHFNALKLLGQLEERGIHTKVVRPKLDDRMFVYMFGRGVPAPKSRFRWCVGNLKGEPMNLHLKELRETLGEKFLAITGVRIGESAARDQRIALSCSRDGAECSQGYFQQSTPASIADVFAPIVHWRVCHVFDFLMMADVELGLSCAPVAEAYGGDEAAEINARTGCIGCNVATRDPALDYILTMPEWAYLAPLKKLRPLYQELVKPRYRHRKPGGETNADGSLCSNQNRLGPYTIEARKYGVEQVLAIQDEINKVALINSRPLISLISDEELERIHCLWEQKTYPQKWDGTEPTGDIIQPLYYPTGEIQNLLFDDF